MNSDYQRVRFRAEPPETGLPAVFAVVTACNPNGKSVTQEHNAIATKTLRDALKQARLVFFPVTGGAPDFSHAEPGFGIVLSNVEEAVEWGRRFRQEAVFWVVRGRVHLVCCAAGDGGGLDIGAWEELANRPA